MADINGVSIYSDCCESVTVSKCLLSAAVRLRVCLASLRPWLGCVRVMVNDGLLTVYDGMIYGCVVAGVLCCAGPVVVWFMRAVTSRPSATYSRHNADHAPHYGSCSSVSLYGASVWIRGGGYAPTPFPDRMV